MIQSIPMQMPEDEFLDVMKEMLRGKAPEPQKESA
jgi:hypothetical protein